MTRQSTNLSSVVVFALAALTSVEARAQSGDGYVIKKSTIDGGGMTHHTGGGYRLGGTIGQHDAGPHVGGEYKLTGGFWSPAIPRPAIVDPSGIDKTRFISFSVPGVAASATGEAALRVKLISLHHVVPAYTGGASVPFTSFEGQARWVGPPTQYLESTSNGTPFQAASLQCTPYYQDWSTVGLVHVTGSAIVPNSIYDVQVFGAGCSDREAECSSVSPAIQIATTRWGDVETPFNPPSLTTQPDLGDVAALVNKFKSVPGAPIKARALLAGDDAFGNITTMNLDLGFGHIAACVDAFKGKPYPHTIQACP